MHLNQLLLDHSPGEKIVIASFWDWQTFGFQHLRTKTLSCWPHLCRRVRVSSDPPKPQTPQTVCSANPSIAPTLETLDDAHLGLGGAALIKDLSVTVSDHRGWSETQYKKERKSLSDVSAPYPSPSSGQLRLTHQSVCALNGNWLSEGWLSVASIYWSSLGQSPCCTTRR